MTDDPAPETLEVVDESDRVIGLAPRAEIHRRRLRHRSAHVFVFDPAGRLFLQFRSPAKDQYPEHWDSSAAGHVDPGESYLGCARRELKEELGLEAELTEVLRVPAQPRTGFEHTVLFGAVTADEPRPNPDEITDGRFFEIGEAREMIDDPAVPTAPALDLLFYLWRRPPARDR
ncbi:MAG: NUDIX domain-containing protein [Proteobacteria bacterium]|nr:NUDIX domain-containing protein [Pseudomonadota bacterium]